MPALLLCFLVGKKKKAQTNRTVKVGILDLLIVSIFMEVRMMFVAYVTQTACVKYLAT